MRRTAPFMTLLAAACVFVVGAVHASKAERAAPPLERIFGGAFQLVDQDGKTRTDADFRGRFMLLTFGYTHCPDVCPLNLQVITQALESLSPRRASRITPVFITVDPQRDTPAVLKAYLAHFHPRFIGLTGPMKRVREALRRYRVHRGIYRQTGRKGRYIDHGSLMYLIGPDGRFLTLAPHTTTARRLASLLRRYVFSDDASRDSP